MSSIVKVAVTAMVLVAALLGVAAASQIPIAGLATLPAGALIALLGALAILPVLVTRLPAALGVFLIWLVVEDLVRKLAGNDIRVYFIKDLLFVAILIALVLDARGKGTWRAATGQSRIFLYVMICWALIMSIPTGLDDWRLPVIGLRLDFMYLPLTAVGFLLVKDADDLRKLLGRLAVIAGAASAVGIAQAIIGPEFLSPGRPTLGLPHLVLVRGLDGSGDVYRPTGTFVEPSRFASMALVGVAVGLAGLMARKRRLNPWMLAASIISAAAVWISGGRAAFLVAVAILAVVIAAPSIAQKRIRIGPAVIAGGSLILSAAAIAVLQPSLLSGRAEWYRATLDLGSPKNEWAFRFGGYGGDTVQGFSLGGVIGQGTGKESLGQQYIYGGEAQSFVGLYKVEGGYASVAVEWGIIGLVLWILWTSVWTWRMWTCVQRVRGSPPALSGIILLTWTAFFLFIGFFASLAGYQNYLANAYFWLFSGMVFALPQAVEGVSTGLPG